MNNDKIIIEKLENINKRISALKDELAILENESYELELKFWLNMKKENEKED